MCVRHCSGACAALRLPLVCTGRAPGQLPFVVEQILEEVVAPLCRRVGPDDLKAAGKRVATDAGAEAVLPAQALILDGRALGLGADVADWTRAMGLAEGVAASDKRHCLFVVHGHAGEGGA